MGSERERETERERDTGSGLASRWATDKKILFLLSVSMSACLFTHALLHMHAHIHTHTQTDTRTQARSVGPGRRGEERKRQRAPVRLPPTSLFASYLCLSVSSFSTNARIVSLLSPLLSPLSRTKEQQFKDQTGVCKIINTTESKTRRKRRQEHG